jgi:hypothetical protein
MYAIVLVGIAFDMVMKNVSEVECKRRKKA